MNEVDRFMIAFVILHYQAMNETIACIDSIKSHVDGDRHIIVVDNASPNLSGVELEKKYAGDAEVDILLSRENLGFARGNNLGYRKARELDPAYIVVLNSDTQIEQDDFAALVEKAYREYTFDVLGPDIYSTRMCFHQNPQREQNFTMSELKKAHRRLVIKNRFKWAVWLKYRLFHLPSDKADGSTRNYEEFQTGKVLHGAFYVFSEKYIHAHADCFYPGTFMYYESYILHYLGMMEGLTFLYDPEIHVTHREDASTEATYDTQYRKSVFVNRCSLASCESFIRLREKYEQKEGKRKELL